MSTKKSSATSFRHRHPSLANRPVIVVGARPFSAAVLVEPPPRERAVSLSARHIRYRPVRTHPFAPPAGPDPPTRAIEGGYIVSKSTAWHPHPAGQSESRSRIGPWRKKAAPRARIKFVATINNRPRPSRNIGMSFNNSLVTPCVGAGGSPFRWEAISSTSSINTTTLSSSEIFVNVSRSAPRPGHGNPLITERGTLQQMAS